MGVMLRAFKHLLPSGKALRITTDKNLRKFFEGLTGPANDVREFTDDVYADVYPGSTRDLPAWATQFGLPDTALSTAEERSRLDAAWKALGGQNPRYLQDTLQGAGFDVYVHEWWEPGTEPTIGSHAAATPRSPLVWLRREFTGVTVLIECGEPLAQCGEPLAQAGNSIEPLGYPLVNKLLETAPNLLILAGEAVAECGEPGALCGNYDTFVTARRSYTVPRDPATWPYFLYIGGETFGTLAQVDPTRRDEFENLCLKLRPAQQWLGMLVEYV